MYGHGPCSIETSGGPHLIEDWLILAQSKRTSNSTSRCCFASSEVRGVETQCEEKFLNSSSEDYVPGSRVGLSHDAGTIVSCSYKYYLKHNEEY